MGEILNKAISQIGRLLLASGCWSRRNERCRKEREQLGKARISPMMNWGCSFTRGEVWRKTTMVHISLPQVAPVRHPSEHPFLFLFETKPKRAQTNQQKLWYTAKFPANNVVLEFQMVKCTFGLCLLTRAGRSPSIRRALLKIKEKSWLNWSSREEAGLRNKPVALLDQQLLHKTCLDRSMLISCRLWALNSATSHSSHKRLWCKVNSIDNYCSAWIPRPLLCNLEVTVLQRRLNGFIREF